MFRDQKHNPVGVAIVSHAPAAVVFALLSVFLSWPLAAGLSTHIPGTGPDDNVMFLWNFLWMRQAVATGAADLFHTPLVFHPGGVDLVLHTHTALNAFVGATLLGGLPLAAALNVTLLAVGALNGFFAYLLAYRATSHRAASIVGGVFFAASPAAAHHLGAHFNLYSVWGLVAFAYAFLEALDRRSVTWSALAGVFFAAVAYTDYYYVVYSVTFACCVLAHRWCGVALTMDGPVAWRRTDSVLLAVAIVASGVAALISLTGGFVVTTPFRISLTTGTNIRALAAAAVLCWLWRRWPVRVRTSLSMESVARERWLLAVVLVVSAALMVPLFDAATALLRNGHYVSQTYFWRSSPAGVDPATVATGNPFNSIWGAWVMRLYAATGMSPFDGPLWMGVVPAVLVATRRTWIAGPTARLWLVVIAVFLVWCLGPYLAVLGVNTGLPLPQMLLRFVPLAANARIPSHAAVVVSLGVAVLLATAIASAGRHWPRWYVGGLLAIILVDFSVAPYPMLRLEAPAIYTRLASLPMAAVLDVPLGIRDGFGEEGRFDPSVLYYQSIHGKPLVGGYVARLSPVVRARIHAFDVLDALLKLSAGATPRLPLPRGEDAVNRLKAAGIGYVVVNRRIATPSVIDFVMSWPLRLIARDGPDELYALE